MGLPHEPIQLEFGSELEQKTLFAQFDCEGGIKGGLTFQVREDTLQKRFYLGLCPKRRIPPAPKIWDWAEEEDLLLPIYHSKWHPFPSSPASPPPSKSITKLKMSTGVGGNDCLYFENGNISALSPILGAGGIRCLGQSPKYNRFWRVPGGQQ